MPIIFIPNHPYQIYGLLIILALIIGETYIYKRLRKLGALPRFALLYCLSSIIPIYIFSVLANLILFQSIGLASAGAALGLIIWAIFFEFSYKNPKFLSITGLPKTKLPKYSIITSSIIALPLFYSIAKLACLSASCCHGIDYHGPFAIKYEWLPGASFPIQPLETVVFFLIFITFSRIKNRSTAAYTTLLVCVVAKFFLDFLRYTHEEVFLSPNQIACIVAFISLLLLKIYSSKNKKILSHRI